MNFLKKIKSYLPTLTHHWTHYLTWLLPHTWAHEGSHWLSLYFLTGHKLAFRPKGYRWIWEFPEDVGLTHRRLVNYAGFAGEFLFSGIFFAFSWLWGFAYLLGACAHFLAYPHYAGGCSDFRE